MRFSLRSSRYSLRDTLMSHFGRYLCDRVASRKAIFMWRCTSYVLVAAVVVFVDNMLLRKCKTFIWLGMWFSLIVTHRKHHMHNCYQQDRMPTCARHPNDFCRHKFASSVFGMSFWTSEWERDEARKTLWVNHPVKLVFVAVLTTATIYQQIFLSTRTWNN